MYYYSQDIFYSKARWALSFAWFPKTCEITGKRIWLKYAYQGIAIWNGPGDAVAEYKWHDKYEHVIWELMRKR